MNSEQFIFWLQGYLELANPSSLDEKQIQIIKDHIALVLTKVTPDRNPIVTTTPIINPLQETFPKYTIECSTGFTPLNPEYKKELLIC